MSIEISVDECLTVYGHPIEFKNLKGLVNAAIYRWNRQENVFGILPENRPKEAKEKLFCIRFGIDPMNLKNLQEGHLHSFDEVDKKLLRVLKIQPRLVGYVER